MPGLPLETVTEAQQKRSKPALAIGLLSSQPADTDVAGGRYLQRLPAVRRHDILPMIASAQTRSARAA